LFDLIKDEFLMGMSPKKKETDSDEDDDDYFDDGVETFQNSI
jgi:hypothetical protein